MICNVLIVDDDFLARNNLKYLIDWYEYGFNVVGEAENGVSAIDFIESNEVDIVITDIYMPIMDGVELIKHLKLNFPGIKVVILSSYSDFNYVKESFQNGAFDYLLKHALNEQDLLNLLTRIKNDILSENFAVKSSLSKEKNNRNNKNEAISRKIKENIIHNTGDIIAGENIIIAVMQVSNFSALSSIYSGKDLNNLKQVIINTLDHIIPKCHEAVIFFSENDKVVFYLKFDRNTNHSDITRKTNEYFRQINITMRKFFNLHVIWGTSKTDKVEFTLHECYEEALNVLESNTNNDNKSKKHLNDINTLSLKQEKGLIAALETMDIFIVNTYIDDIFSSFNIGEELSQTALVGELITIVSRICDEYHIENEEIYSCISKGKKIMMLNESLHVIVAWAKELFEIVINVSKNQKDLGKSSPYVQSAIKFINESFSEDIMLKDIANKVGITMQYLSKIFKDVKGETITNYITNLRIEKAKQLIENGEINIKYLYFEVGFNSYNYFFTAFKKNVGCTPLEYKRKCKAKII